MARRTKRTGPATRLEEVTKRWRTGSGSGIVPVLGAGVNMQAARGSTDKEDDWRGLMQRACDKAGLPKVALKRLPESFIQQWETIVRSASRPHEGQKVWQTELMLQTLITAHLADVEHRGPTELHRRLATAGFQDLISLNFDRRVAKGLKRPRMHAAPPRIDHDEETLWRHDSWSTPELPCRCWYPHGDSAKSSTIKLGVRRYGMALAGLEGARKRHMGRLTQVRKAEGERPKDWHQRARAWPDLNWFDVFLYAPVVFIGCSLASDEWPLWWVLHQRARNLWSLPPRQRPETLVLLAGPVPANLRGKPAEVELVHFPSFDALWRAVDRSLLTA